MILLSFRRSDFGGYNEPFFLFCQIPLRGTPHQITYFVEKNLYSLIVSVPVSFVRIYSIFLSGS